jgi:hypothetical protein
MIAGRPERPCAGASISRAKFPWASYDEWLSCPVADAPKFFKQWQLDAYPALLLPQAKTAKPAEPPPSTGPPDDTSLF